MYSPAPPASSAGMPRHAAVGGLPPTPASAAAPTYHVHHYDAAAPRWSKGNNPGYGIPAGVQPRGDDGPARPHMRVFPGRSQAEGPGPIHQQVAGPPVWLTELQGSYRDHSAGGGGAQVGGTAAGAKHQADEQGGERRGLRIFPARRGGGWQMGGGAQPAAVHDSDAGGGRGGPASVSPAPSSSSTATSRHLQNFQSQLQEDIYQRFRHIKDAFLAMDRNRSGRVERPAVQHLCKLCNLSGEPWGGAAPQWRAVGTHLPHPYTPHQRARTHRQGLLAAGAG